MLLNFQILDEAAEQGRVDTRIRIQSVPAARYPA